MKLMLDRLQLPTGTDLSYYDSGTGQAIVLVHGHPFDHTMWQPQIELLAASHRVLVPDLRGYGQTPLPPGTRETLLDDHAADILALTAALRIDRFIIAGVSQGGQIALETWYEASDRIRALILSDTSAGLDTPEARKARLTTADRLDYEGMNGYATEVLEKMITPANAIALPNVADHVMRMMTTSNPAGAAASARGRCQRRDYLPLLPQIAIPTLILVGSEDAFTPIPFAEQMHQAIPNSRLAIIQQAGHLPNLERPNAFNAHLDLFLSTLECHGVV